MSDWSDRTSCDFARLHRARSVPKVPRRASLVASGRACREAPDNLGWDVKVSLQPASLATRGVRGRVEATLRNRVPFRERAELLEPEIVERLERMFPSGSVSMWGLIPSVVRCWERLRPGDAVMFYGEGKFYLTGTIATLWRSAPLAEQLWGRNEKNQTWEYMYAITDLRPLDVPLPEVRRILGWADNAIPMGVAVYEDSKADRLIELANLDPGSLVTDEEGLAQTSGKGGGRREFEGGTEAEGFAKRRREQRWLKNRLMELGVDSCALCGRALPGRFLVAAHIKRRSECSEKEKVDFDNIGMLACLLGCDSLYEHGYLTVDRGGALLVSDRVAESPAVEEFVRAHLAGKVSSWWSPEREPYFAWHRSHTFIRSFAA